MLVIKVGDYVVHKGKFGLGIVKNISYSEIKTEFLIEIKYKK